MTLVAQKLHTSPLSTFIYYYYWNNYKCMTILKYIIVTYFCSSNMDPQSLTHFISPPGVHYHTTKTCQTDTATHQFIILNLMRYEKMLMKKGLYRMPCTSTLLQNVTLALASSEPPIWYSFHPNEGKNSPPEPKITETTARALLTWRKTNKPERERHEKHFLWKPISTKENKQKILKHHRI